MTFPTLGAIIPLTANRTQVILRLDNDVLDWFRSQVEQAGGGNYQELINLALREYVVRHRDESLESISRHSSLESRHGVCAGGNR